MQPRHRAKRPTHRRCSVARPSGSWRILRRQRSRRGLSPLRIVGSRPLGATLRASPRRCRCPNRNATSRLLRRWAGPAFDPGRCAPNGPYTWTCCPRATRAARLARISRRGSPTSRRGTLRPPGVSSPPTTRSPPSTAGSVTTRARWSAIVRSSIVRSRSTASRDSSAIWLSSAVGLSSPHRPARADACSSSARVRAASQRPTTLRASVTT